MVGDRRPFRGGADTVTAQEQASTDKVSGMGRRQTGADRPPARRRGHAAGRRGGGA
jgi:hypothetical protein